ncbi:phosphoenolpyruvate carboxylase [Mycobacterium fragae]|nr:phosphoenolpyruvate carboxylase [Mycobacterium fragae]
MDIVPAIEDQLLALQPICSAQRVSTGITCGAPAVAVAEVHAVDECDQMGLSPDGDLVETLCQACLATLQSAMATYVGHKREAASRCGTHPACTTCGRPTGYLRSVFAVRPIGPEGLA